MIRRVILAATFLVLSAAVATAADLNGRWEGTISGPNGDIQIAFTFKVDGNKLTGSAQTGAGEAPLEDGKVDGDKFSFNTHFDDNVITHEGTLSGDTVDLKVHGPWGDSEMTLKRAAEKKEK